MPAGPNPPGGPPSSSGKPGGKRPAIGLQIKLPCTSMADVKSRYGAELRQARFFIRTRSLRPADTLVRLEAQLSGGAVAFRAAAVVARAVEPILGGPEPGMALQLVAVDEAGRDLIASLGGQPPPPLKADPVRPAPPSPPPRPSIMSMPGIKPPPPPDTPKETTAAPPPPSASQAPAAEKPSPVQDTGPAQHNGKASGFFGWLKRLFGGSPQPRV